MICSNTECPKNIIVWLLFDKEDKGDMANIIVKYARVIMTSIIISYIIQLLFW